MKRFSRLFLVALSGVIMAFSIVGCGAEDDATTNTSEQQEMSDTKTDTNEKMIKIGVLFDKSDDTYISNILQSLEKIQQENESKVEFTFYDSKGEQSTQNDNIDTILQKDVDVLFVNLVDVGAGQTVIDKIKESGKPVVFFNSEPSIDTIKSYDKAIFVGTNSKEAGILQGKILANLWNTNKGELDTNGDGKMQYVMLQGELDNPENVDRTEYSISTIKDSGIEVEELAKQVCNSDKALAKSTTEGWVSEFGDGIEVIIANNDIIAQGVVSGLQSQGFNQGENSKTIPIVGVDATVETQDLIQKGYMAGSVLQDAESMAQALYIFGINLAEGKSAIEGTDYVFDDTGIAVRIPYQEYTK